jgi:hypothetical protein
MRTISEELDAPNYFEDVMAEMFTPAEEAPCPRWLVVMKAFEKLADTSSPNIGESLETKEEDLA